MPIRAMTKTEIVRALRRAAEICVTNGRICWGAIDVCRADGTHAAAEEYVDGLYDGNAEFADTPLHAALFLDICAELHTADAI